MRRHQVLAMLTKNGLITLERVAADGAKIRANVLTVGLTLDNADHFIAPQP